jgi:hypothetical protein
MARKRREPTIDVREHACADGSVTEMWSVRYYDATGARPRLRCASREEADFERARLVLAEARGEPVAASPVEASGSELTLAGFWPMYRADAESRLARSTLREYERIWDRRLGPRFGGLVLGAIRPCVVSEWRAELLADGVGAEAVRYAMVLLQAMFTLAIEWGEAQANPVSGVRKPRQGRQRAIDPLAPEDIEPLRAILLDDGDHRSATLVRVLAYAGLRPGEALGLEWRHVRDRTLLIEQAGQRRAASSARRPTASIARSTCSIRSQKTSPTGRRRHARAGSSSHGRMASPGAPTTGTTGATATSILRPLEPALAVHARTT